MTKCAINDDKIGRNVVRARDDAAAKTPVYCAFVCVADRQQAVGGFFLFLLGVLLLHSSKKLQRFVTTLLATRK